MTATRSPRHIFALAAALACVSATAGPRAARAHGTIPTSNSVSFGPATGAVLLGTNFGGVLVQGSDLAFLCERGVTGEQTSVDVWQWLGSGAIAGVVTTGGFVRGAWLSEPGGCGFGVAAGTEDLLMVDLAADPRRADGFYALGATTGPGAEARLVARAEPGPAVVLAREPGATGTTVRAAGDTVYAGFVAPTEVVLVRVTAGVATRLATPRSDGASLRPIGVDPRAPLTVWLVARTETADVLLKSQDGGATTHEVLRVDARLGGFAIDGDRVFVQSARLGVHASQDGGESFALVDGSPHGTCLAVGPDRRLYACGVPWQDGMALGARAVDPAASTAFEPVVARYDDIAAALACETHTEVTALCDDELAFLRGYYGFEPTGAEVEPSPEPAPESAPEPDPDPTSASDADGGATSAEAGPSPADGCRGGGLGELAPALALVGVLCRAAARRASSPPAAAAPGVAVCGLRRRRRGRH